MNDIVSMLKTYTEIAEQDDVVSAALVLCRRDGGLTYRWNGEITQEEKLLCGIGALGNAVRASIDNSALPIKDKSLDASYVVYDVATGPLGFDYLVWLVTAEMGRIREGAPDPLKVGFWQGREPSCLMEYKSDTMPDRSRWLDNVFRPMLKLLGAVEDQRAVAGRSIQGFVTRKIVDNAKRGETVPRIKVEPDNDYDGAVTITLREAAHFPERNSDLIEWTRFAEVLKQKGERVIFVRDTEKADDPIEGFEVHPKASRDILSRASLYQAARTNLFVSNGPASLAIFSERPWLEFIKEGPDNYLPNTPLFWKEEQGVEVGSQYPWSADNQQIIWKEASLPNLLEAWEAHAPLI